MMISVLCESPRDRHPQEKCASKCVRGNDLSAFIYFFNTRLQIAEVRSLEFVSCWQILNETKERELTTMQKGVGGTRHEAMNKSLGPQLRKSLHSIHLLHKKPISI